jgi:hypothetical protein
MHFSNCSSVTMRKFASKFADRTEVLIRQCKRKSGLRPWWGKGKRNIADAGYGAGDCSASNPDIAPSSWAVDCTEPSIRSTVVESARISSRMLGCGTDN